MGGQTQRLERCCHKPRGARSPQSWKGNRRTLPWQLRREHVPADTLNLDFSLENGDYTSAVSARRFGTGFSDTVAESV